MAKIVVVGSFNADLISYMERMPRPGETVNGYRFVTGPGGKGSNQAVAAARLNADVTFIGRVGNDAFAELAMQTWQDNGINMEYVVRDPDHATGVAPIFVDDQGENSIVVIGGANLQITRADIDAAIDQIKKADILIVQLEINHNIVAYALGIAKERGVQTILNPAPATRLTDDLLAKADFITPNETELEILSGHTNDDVEILARRLMKREDQTIIVTLGSQGARYVTQDTSVLIGTFEVDAVDTTGAGDAFNGGLAVGLAEGLVVNEAVRLATATAALCVTRPGATLSMPRRDEVNVLLKR